MTITVEFKARDFARDLIIPKNIIFTPVHYSNRAIGGPYQADINVTGPDLSLWSLLEFLRCPVFLRAEEGDRVWWGYVAEVEIIAKNPFSEKSTKIRVGAALDSMFNRVAVAWEDIAVGTQAGERMTTAWADDSLSQSEYGIKEALWSGASASDATLAEQARDILLEQKKYPIPTFELDVTGDVSAVLHCRGWWDTLNWLYCSVPVELALAYTTVNFNFGVGRTGYERIAQGIVPSGGDINLSSVKIYARSTGAPTDDITVSIYTNPDDLTPTTLIQDGAAIANADITGSYQWLESTFTPEVALTSGTKYFIVITRSGAVDDVNYFEIGTDSGAGYAAGTMVFYDGATWNTYAGDIAFQLFDNDIVLTSTQALSIITNYGQFFRIVESEVDSGIYSESYRDGDGSAHFEVEELLQHGTTNNRRMLTKIDDSRRCTIYEEDANSAGNYYKILSDGSMLDNYGAAVRPELAKCAVYARLVDVIPPSVDTTFLGNMAVRFIEITDYDCKTGKTTYTARDELDPFVTGRPLDG